MDLIDDDDIVSREEMKKEAITRMKRLKLLGGCIEKFKEDKLQMSYNGYLFDLPSDIEKVVREHEKQFDEVIYHVIHSFSSIGETYECLFVSRYRTDWTFERNMLRKNIVYAYVENKTLPDCSEAGSILVQNVRGCLLRIG